MQNLCVFIQYYIHMPHFHIDIFIKHSYSHFLSGVGQRIRRYNGGLTKSIHLRGSWSHIRVQGLPSKKGRKCQTAQREHSVLLNILFRLWCSFFLLVSLFYSCKAIARCAPILGTWLTMAPIAKPETSVVSINFQKFMGALKPAQYKERFWNRRNFFDEHQSI